ncbi:acyltransferase [Mycobacteroides abscessus subsp. abscessus]|nr:acyltransferase [Mycobacteroides abscessus]MBN7551051.1 acyltransferase [Mycobacteroides abscessus subsp. abscessus]OLT79497.1 acyltransferase [Mycobacteroides abscessus subsp. abscessus]PVB37684.1 acyltransferase [Mycobacteroides abscessus]QSM72023.1 acyltransferase [Mycobacteroides abscessus subsp. abscessus]
MVQNCYGTGMLDLGALQGAFNSLVEQYPILAGHMRLSVKGFVLRFARRPDTTIDFADVGDQDVGEYAAGGGSNLPFGRVCALRVCRSGQRFRLSLLLHHSIADAAAALKFCEDLWFLYTARIEVENSGPTVITPGRIPESSESLLRARGYTESSKRKMNLRPAYRGIGWIWTSLWPRRIERGRIHLSRSETENLRALVRGRGTTIHGLVTAMLALTERRITGNPNLAVAVSSYVNLRSRVVPPIAAAEGTNVLGVAELILNAHEDCDGMDLARQVVDDIRDGLDTGRIHKTSLLAFGEIRRVLRLVALYFPWVLLGGLIPRFTAIQVTNWGQIPQFQTPTEVRIDDFRGGVELHGLIRFLAARAVATVDGHIYFVTSFNGRLSIDFTKLAIGRNNAQRIEAAFREEFMALVCQKQLLPTKFHRIRRLRGPSASSISLDNSLNHHRA